MTAQPKLLQQTILDGGIRAVNFFNGRLLTGEDLTREQTARREADRRLGIALGDGIAWGLEVNLIENHPLGSVVTINAGLAINRNGQTLHLPNPLDVLLSDRSAPKVATTRSFIDCGLKGGVIATKPGTYLLTIAPDEANVGRAQSQSLDEGSVRCNSDALVEAVQIRMLPLTVELDVASRADNDRLRNAVAWQCFGLDYMANFLIDPLRMPAQIPEPLETLVGKTYTRCDVPLAVVRVTTKIEFVDLWSVRRRLTPRGCAGAFAYPVEERRRAEGEAMSLQFQQQLAGMTVASGDVRGLAASKKFVQLPAAGLLPMPGDAAGDAAAIASFFAGCTVRGPAYIEGARLETLLRESYSYPPINPNSGELIWLYWVRENRQAIDLKRDPKPRACLVFTSGHMPYQADARLDVAKWDYANTEIDR
ncbi:MAG: hypothetical protein PHI29_11995 [Gallionella sp.]|nr:hypothetical protein [Gallionella sp.]